MLSRCRSNLSALTLLALGAGALTAQQEAGPKATVAESVVDVGAVNKGQKVTHEFTIRNEGTRPLEITEVKPACGCTVTEFDRQVPPGGSGKVKAVVDTSSFRGPIAKSVQVFTNDPENPRISLVIKASIQALLEADPGYVRFIAVQGEKRQQSVQTVWSTEKEDLTVLGIDSPYPFVKASYREAEAGERHSGASGRQWRLEITLDQDAPTGALNDFLLVRTDHPRQGVLRIPVSGFVRPVLTVTPRIADFGRRELSEPQTASLEIKNLSSRSVELGEIASDLEGLEAEVEAVEDGRLFKVLLTLSPGLPKGAFEGLLTINTSSQRLPVLEISVRGVVL